MDMLFSKGLENIFEALQHSSNISCTVAHSGQIEKNPPKITFEKFVKLSGHTCVCNNLTSLQCEVYKNQKRK